MFQNKPLALFNKKPYQNYIDLERDIRSLEIDIRESCKSHTVNYFFFMEVCRRIGTSTLIKNLVEENLVEQIPSNGIVPDKQQHLLVGIFDMGHMSSELCQNFKNSNFEKINMWKKIYKRIIIIGLTTLENVFKDADEEDEMDIIHENEMNIIDLMQKLQLEE